MQESKIVTSENYGEVFDGLWSRLSRRFFKLEHLPLYDDADSPSYAAFRAGDVGTCMELFEESIQDEIPLLNEIPKRGLSYVRLRATDLPLGPYLKWEFLTYQVSARYGQTILVHELTEVTRQLVRRTSDFMLFDDYAVIVLRYDDQGRRSAIELLEAAEDIASFAAVARQLSSSAVLLGVFEQRLRFRL